MDAAGASMWMKPRRLGVLGEPLAARLGELPVRLLEAALHDGGDGVGGGLPACGACGRANVRPSLDVIAGRIMARTVSFRRRVGPGVRRRLG